MNSEKPLITSDLETRRPFFSRLWDKYVKNNPKAYLFWAFFLPAAIMFTIYAALGTYPFGRSSVLVLDLNGQYVYFFEALRDFVYGEGSLLYSFGRALGGEFMGVYAYYLASPLSYIVCLFPKHAILEALYFMFVIKCGLCGLTFGYFIHRSGRVRGKAATVMFSAMYALCGYCVIYQHNTMWIDCVILLPLVALGIEELISNRKYLLFTLSLALAILSNFYIGYMMCFFVIIYSVYAFFARTPAENNPHGERFHLPRSIARVALFSVIGAAISMLVTLPAVYALTFGKNDFQNPTFAATQRFDFFDLLSMFFVGSYDTVRPEGLPVVYCGMLALILLPIYFLCKRPRRERIGTALLIGLFVLCFNFNPVDMAWHGFQIPNWLNYRYSFMLCFVILVAGRRAFDRLGEHGPRTVLAVCSALGLVVLVIQKLGLDNMPDFSGVWLSLAFLVVYCIALSLSSHSRARETSAMIMAVLVSLEMFCSGLLNLVKLDEDVVISSYDSYHDFIDAIQPIIDEVKESDPSFYRMEKNDHRKVNDPLALGFRGLSNSTSTLNAETILFLQRMGYSSRSHWSKYLGGTPVSDSLLGLKYLIAKTDDATVDALWGSPALTDEANGYVAYRNPYVLPLAYTVNPDIKELYFSDPNKGDYEEDNENYIDYREIYSPCERMNAMITAMLGSEEKIEIFKTVKKADISYDNINLSFASSHKKYAPINDKVDATLEFTVTADTDATIYAYFPSRYPREVNLTLDGASFGTYYANETQRILTVGKYTENKTFLLEMTLTGSDLYIMSGQNYFWYIDEDVYRDAMTRLATGGFVIDEYSERSFSGTITADADNTTVFTTLPYDEGWNVYVDGEKTEIFKTLDALIAFDITPGTHTLKIEYMPDAFVYGVALTLGGCVLLLFILIFDRKIRKVLVRIFPADTGCPEPVEYEDGYAPEYPDGEEDDETGAPELAAPLPAENRNGQPQEEATQAASPAPAETEAAHKASVIPDSEVLGTGDDNISEKNADTSGTTPPDSAGRKEK